LTPGKQNCFVKGLAPAQKQQITVEEPLNKVLGILIVWDNAANRGKAVVFKYDWGKACEVARMKFSDFSHEKGMADPRFFTSRLKGNFGLMPYLDKPSEFVTVAKETEVTGEMFVKMISAGSNPYEVIGLTRRHNGKGPRSTCGSRHFCPGSWRAISVLRLWAHKSVDTVGFGRMNSWTLPSLVEEEFNDFETVPERGNDSSSGYLCLDPKRRRNPKHSTMVLCNACAETAGSYMPGFC
jgi:hypothetical protein